MYQQCLLSKGPAQMMTWLETSGIHKGSGLTLLGDNKESLPGWTVDTIYKTPVTKEELREMERFWKSHRNYSDI